MNTKEMRELDAWIAENVTGVKPTQEAWAMTEDETGIALSEGGVITRRCVMDFCAEFTEYHCVIQDIYPSYTTDPAAAMLVLEKCQNETTVSMRKQSNGSTCVWWTESETMKENYIIGETLQLAICLLAKKLFEKGQQ